MIEDLRDPPLAPTDFIATIHDLQRRCNRAEAESAGLAKHNTTPVAQYVLTGWLEARVKTGGEPPEIELMFLPLG